MKNFDLFAFETPSLSMAQTIGKHSNQLSVFGHQVFITVHKRTTTGIDYQAFACLAWF